MRDTLCDFTHVAREEHEPKLHFSHLFRYVSAYEGTEYTQAELRQALLEGLAKAKVECTPQIVDQDGDMR